jgi:FMN-dependent NADH-azoreductase
MPRHSIGRFTDGGATPATESWGNGSQMRTERSPPDMARTETTGTRLLHVIATPRGLASNTGRVTSCLLEALRDDEDGLEIDTLDLFRADLPSVAGKNIETKYRVMTGQAPDEDGRESWSQIEKTIDQFLAADVYLLTVPMWNLGIPYVLKYYIDAIVQPGYLFRYTPEGFVEPLVNGKKMIVVLSSGSEYATEPMRSFDFAEPYLRAIFGFVGITDVTVFRAGGMDVSPAYRKAGQRAAIDEARAFVRSGAWRPARRPVRPAAATPAARPTTPRTAAVPAPAAETTSAQVLVA